MHARIQTWAPFRIRICLNGREWLARGMDKAGLGYVRRENCFTWLEDPDKAQRLMNRQVQAAWPDLLNAVAHQLNPAHEEMFRGFPVQYYWSAHQTEWATDTLFRDTRTLAGLYPRLVQHGLTTFLSPDVMRFLGRNVPPQGTVPPRLAAPRSTILPGSRSGEPRKANPRQPLIGVACVKASPICIAVLRFLRRRTSGIWRRWRRSKTPPGSVRWRQGCASRHAGTAGARGRSIRWERPTPNYSKRSAAESSRSTDSVTAI
jgi:hypothetical protein